ncbi:hypothetical protein J2X46_000866 [Nocardioides sp. BE266]|uniref:hypothetical protein n=1 Tax=Nocardioides sp. BE266 TaxID=2817725 RepID=UPI002866E105|nr:hypothetical protein [Nocardioides sp. BE266]MDR7251890.1 hypothetical protein [Nocardioides sp. BE266]
MRLFLRILAGLVALVVVGYLAVNGAVLVRAHQQRDDIAGQVTTALEEAVPAAADRQQDLAAAAGREPDAYWIEQACAFDTDDAGWMVQSYREVCAVRSVSAWQVASPGEGQSLLAVEGQGATAYDGCQPLGTVDKAQVTYVDAGTADGEPWCTHSLGTSSSARGLVGDRAALEPGRWVLAIDAEPLVDEPIGCVHWSVIFCDNPFGDRHAFGEAPSL